MGAAIRFRYDATCHVCNVAIPAGARAGWDRATKRAACAACLAASEPVTTTVDGSAVSVSVPGAVEASRLRSAAVCSASGVSMAAGTDAQWDKTAKPAAHPACPPVEPAGTREDASSIEDEPLDVGVAGGSARRIADRQQARRDRAKQRHDEAVRQAHPRAGNLMLKAGAFFSEPEKPTSWQKGAAGEESAGRTFERLIPEGFQVLHDRRKPGTKWNIDHVVVGPRGIYVIDAKNYSGRLEIRSTGSIFRPGPNRVFVKGRAQDKRVAGMDWQVEWVEDAVGDLAAEYGAVIRPVLCFIGVELGFTQKAVLVGANDVLVTWPRRFVKDVGRDGPLGAEQINELAHRIAEQLPAAVTARP